MKKEEIVEAKQKVKNSKLTEKEKKEIIREIDEYCYKWDCSLDVLSSQLNILFWLSIYHPEWVKEYSDYYKKCLKEKEKKLKHE